MIHFSVRQTRPLFLLLGAWSVACGSEFSSQALSGSAGQDAGLVDANNDSDTSANQGGAGGFAGSSGGSSGATATGGQAEGGAGTGGQAGSSAGNSGSGGGAACPAEHQCASAFPSTGSEGTQSVGWYEPATTTPCPAPAPTEIKFYTQPYLDNQPDATCACACSSPPAAQCASQLSCSAGSNCSSGISMGLVGSTQCTGFNTISSTGPISCQAEKPIVEGGQNCTAIAEVTGKPPVAPPMRACVAELASLTSCGAGRVCVPIPPPSTHGPCLSTTEPMDACPQDYPIKFVHYTAVDDTRGCSVDACSCTPPGTGCECVSGNCGMTIFAAGNTCSGELAMISATDACSTVNPGDAGSSVGWGARLTGFTPVAAPCASGGTPASVGQLLGKNPLTFCCAKQQ